MYVSLDIFQLTSSGYYHFNNEPTILIIYKHSWEMFVASGKTTATRAKLA